MNREQLVEEAVKKISNQKRHTHHHKNRREGHKAILFYLVKNGGSALSGEIASHTNLSTPRLAYLLKELENDGMILRESLPDDHRKVCVSLTEKGTNKVLHKRHDLEESIRKLFHRLDDRDIEAFFRILEKIEEIEQEEKQDFVSF